MDIQGDMQITLVIKAPNQRMEDQTVDCMLGWTIRKLKHHLESVYPSKPKHHEQRLIYSGKLLQDHLTLKEILKQYDSDVATSTHTVHLVCSNSSSSSPKASKSSSSQRANESTSPHFPLQAAHIPNPTNATSDLTPQQQSSSPLSPQASSAETPGLSHPNIDGLRFRGTGQFPQQNTPVTSTYQAFPGFQSYSPFGMPGTPPVTPPPMPPAGYPYSPEQYAWVVQQQQQVYSQYMMQYMQYYQQSIYGAGVTAGTGGQPFIPPFMSGTPPPTPTTPIPPQQQPLQQQQQQQPAAAAGANNPAAPPAQPQQQQRANNVRMNAQGGVDEDDEDEINPRDWLHHTYFIMRFLTFVGIIVFYSSFSRFIMVMGGFLVIYFFQKVRVAREQNLRREQEEQQREEERQQQQQQQQEGANAQQPQEAQENGNTGTNTTPVADDSANDSSNQEQQDQPDGDTTSSTDTEQEGGEQQVEEEEGNKVKRVLYFVYKTVESFFSSLVPAPPELMEAN